MILSSVEEGCDQKLESVHAPKLGWIWRTASGEDDEKWNWRGGWKCEQSQCQQHTTQSEQDVHGLHHSPKKRLTSYQ